MNIYCCGLNYKTAPIGIREQLARELSMMTSPGSGLIEHPHINEVALLSTCNRTEVYCTVSSANKDFDLVNCWLGTLAVPAQFASYMYCHQNNAAVEHLLKVASGLDSMVLGEAQILSQLKKAVAAARSSGTLGGALNRLFEYVFHATKQVRAQSALNVKPFSAASVSVRLAKQIFDDFSRLNVLFIGVSQINQLAIRHFYEQGVRKIWVANRTVSKAWQMASTFGGCALDLNELSGVLAKVDLVVSSTGSTDTILTKQMITNALSGQKQRPILLIDLAIPRDIEPMAAECENVYLYTIDDLQQVIRDQAAEHQVKAAHAHHLVKAYSDHYQRQIHAEDANSTIKALHEHARQLSQQETDYILRKMKAGMPIEQALDYLTHRITKKLLHMPTKKLRQAAYDGKLSTLNLATELFGIVQEK